jgi:hypothetical protein
MKKKKPSYKKLRRAFLLALGSCPDLETCLNPEDRVLVDEVSKEILKKWSLDGTRKKKVAVQG